MSKDQQTAKQEEQLDPIERLRREVAENEKRREKSFSEALADAKRDIMDGVNDCLNLPRDTVPQKLRYELLNPAENAADMRPEFKDARLWLRYAPGKGQTAISVSPGDAARRLPTGCRLRVPEGYAAIVCQVEQHNGKNRFIASEVLMGTTDEVEVIYRAAAHHYVSPGRVIGCVLLLPLALYAAEMAK